MFQLNSDHAINNHFVPKGFTLCEPNTFTVAGKVTSDDIVQAAKILIKQQIKTYSTRMDSKNKVKDFLIFELAREKSEVFCALFLTNKNELIRFDRLFQGTINQATVYPREIIRRIIELNAASVIFVHNHPSGHDEPSDGDERITTELVKLLKKIDVAVLDHFIVAGDLVYSFAEYGKLYDLSDHPSSGDNIIRF